MSGGIDYSKWDHFKDDSSNDDWEDVGFNGSSCRVTRLDRSSKVTRAANGEIIIENESSGGDSRPNSTSGEDVATRVPVHPAPTVPTDDTMMSLPSSWTEKGGSCDIPNSTTKLHWSQDRSTVTLRVLLPPADSTKGWVCDIANLLPFDRRHSAVGHAELQRLRVHRLPNHGSQVLLEGVLPHPVHANEGEAEADWTIESLKDQKYLTIFLSKATPLQGLTLWWKRPLMDCPEVCIDWERGSSSAAFAKAWDEAHQMFREKRSQGAERHADL